jgi:2-methylaconitate cis-trans-isomerase PrpF
MIMTESKSTEQIATPMVYYRGGTSKAVIIDRRHLPIDNEEQLAAWILAAYGSPDARQIDGLGGADPLTSKFAVVGPPTRPDADIDYTFYQVAIKSPLASRDANCGNISSAMGPYAIEEGFVKATGDLTTVRVHATNFEEIITIKVQTKEGLPRVLGNQHISGVPGTGSPLILDLHKLVGTHGKGLLPTGRPSDTIGFEDLGQVEYSVVDLANMIVFAKAESFGLSGTENPDDLDADKELMKKFERFRLAVGVKLGFASNVEEARIACSNSPFLALISKAQDWNEYSSGTPHKAAECDFHAFSLLDELIHKSYQVTGSSCVAAAAFVPGTIVNTICGKTGLAGTIRIGHPSGIMDVKVAIEKTDRGFDVTEASLIRTARRLAEGNIYVAVNRLPWRKESGGNPHMRTVQPKAQAQLRNETFYSG